MTDPTDEQVQTAAINNVAQVIAQLHAAAADPRPHVSALANAILDEPLDWKGNTLRNPTASTDRDNSSTAYGIPQFLNATFRATSSEPE